MGNAVGRAIGAALPAVRTSSPPGANATAAASRGRMKELNKRHRMGALHEHHQPTKAAIPLHPHGCSGAGRGSRGMTMAWR